MNEPETYFLQSPYEVAPPWMQLGVRLISPGVDALGMAFPEHQVFAAMVSIMITHARDHGIDPATFRARMVGAADAYEERVAEPAHAAT